MKAADIKSWLKEGCLLSSFKPNRSTAETTWDHLYEVQTDAYPPENGKQKQIIDPILFYSILWRLVLDKVPLLRWFLSVRIITYEKQFSDTAKAGSPPLSGNHELDARTRNQLRNPWRFGHSEHTGRQAVIPHAPFRDWCIHFSSTARTTTLHAHNIGLCIMYRGCLNTMMVKRAMRISHSAETACFHFEWLAFGGGVLTASVGFDPTNRSDLNKLCSIICCLGLKSFWKNKWM